MDIVQLIGFVVSMLLLFLLTLKQGRERRPPEEVFEEFEEPSGESKETPLKNLVNFLDFENAEHRKKTLAKSSIPSKKTQKSPPKHTHSTKSAKHPEYLQGSSVNPYEAKRPVKAVPGKALLKSLKSLKEMVILNEIIDKPKWKE